MKVKTAVLSLAAVVCLLTAGGTWAKVIYVDDDAPIGGDGISWTTAYRFLQDALRDANVAGGVVEVRVAQGIYQPDQGVDVELGDTKATFRLLSGVTIKGGYAGLGQPDPNAWDPVLYETILYGDLQGNDDFQNTRTLPDNSLHIVTSIGVDETAVMEGLAIAHGAYLGPIVGDRGAEGEPLLGGGGLCNESGSPLIRQCIFSQNYVGLGYGSAVFNYTGGAAHYEECTFEDNRGTAVVNRESHCTFQNCRFIDNSSTGIYQMDSTSELNNCLFRGNKGGCIRLLDTTSRATISDCIFTDNAGAIDGGQVECENCTFEGQVNGSVDRVVDVNQGSFVDCLFLRNSARYVLYATSLELNHCTFAQNRVGRAFVTGCSEGQIRQCLFSGNLCNEGYGVLYVRAGATITNCTFACNRTTSWGIITAGWAPEPVVVMNCILRDNNCFDASWPPIIGGNDLTIGYSNVPMFPELQYLTIETAGNVDVDPLFADPGYWDPNGTADDLADDFFVEGDYHLKSQAGRWDPNSQSWVQDDVTSPCIDAGDPNSHIGDEPFPNGGRINMGAYGGTAEASKSYFGEPVSETILAGDLNGDGKVDWLDPSILASHWLETGEGAED